MSTKTNLRGITAAGTSIAIGVVGSISGVAPAEAQTTGPVGVDPCTNIAGVFENFNGFYAGLDFSNPYVLPCVPQYGLGKVEFTVSSDHDLPPGFDLAGTSVTSVTENFSMADVMTYFGQDPSLVSSVYPFGSFLEMSRVDDLSDPTSATYDAIVVLPLASVEVVATSDLPADCTGTYTHAYRVTAEPRTTTFSGQSGSTMWSVPVTVTPQPITFAVNVDPTGTSTNSQACFSIPGWTQAITDVSDADTMKLITAYLLALGLFSASGLTDQLPSDFTSGSALTNFSVGIQETPVLPDTGRDATTATAIAAFGALMAAFGAALVIVRRRRSSTLDA